MFQKLKIFNFQPRTKAFCLVRGGLSIFDSQRGMSYVELIVVISIFFTMSAVVFSSANNFQARARVRSLANDIGLKIIETQKTALSGKLPPYAQQQYLLDTLGPNNNWKPAYGVYFHSTVDQKNFKFFTDLDGDQSFTREGDVLPDLESLENFSITKGNYISKIEVDSTLGGNFIAKGVSIVCTRPSSAFVFTLYDTAVIKGDTYNAVRIYLTSPSGISSVIKVYSSGRIEIK